MRTPEEIAMAATVAGVLTTLLEFDRAPRSIIQAAMQKVYPIFLDLHRFQLFCGVLESSGLIEQTAGEMWLTEKGKKAAEDLEESLNVG